MEDLQRGAYSVTGVQASCRVEVFFAAVFQGALERGGGFFWRGFLELRLLRRGVLGAKDGSKLVLWVSSRGKPERN